MNKYFALIVLCAVVIIAFILIDRSTSTRTATLDDPYGCSGKGTELTIDLIAKRLEWRFEPETIEVKRCDHVTVKITNEDDFDHGFALDAFGVLKRVPALSESTVDFVATKTGTFAFYCPLACGASSDPKYDLAEGVVQTGPHAGTVRGHSEHIGTFIVTD